MTLVEQERENEAGETEIGVCVGFQDDEEFQLADAVMKLLSQPAFRGASREFLERVYWNGRAKQAPRLWAEELDRTMDIFEEWSKLGWFDCKMPAFLDGNENILENNSTQINMGLRQNTENLILVVWQDAWERYKADLVKLSDDYREFSGAREFKKRSMLRNPQPHLDRALEVESQFWEEVEKIRTKTSGDGRFSLNWEDSYKYVLDYMPRGRDVIPGILMVHWLEIEASIPEFIPHAIFPEEDWVNEAREESAQQIARAAEYTKTERDRL